MKKVLAFIKTLVEELWQVVVLIWNLPVGIIELIWLRIFDKEKFNYNWGLLVEAIKGKRNK